MMEHDVSTTETKTETKFLNDARLLKATRTKHGLYVWQLGLLLGLTQPAVTHIEVGRNKRLSKLARRELEMLYHLPTEEVTRRLDAVTATSA
jgi:hypothetical protein